MVLGKLGFSDPITEFGIGIKDLEQGQLYSLQFTTSNSETGKAASIISSGGVKFFGIRSDTAFGSIAFSPQGTMASGADLVIFDDVAMTAIPEPATLIGLLGLWLAGIVAGWSFVPASAQAVSGI